MTSQKQFSEVVLRVDAWEAVNRHLEGLTLTPIQKELCRVAHESIAVAIRTPLKETDPRSIA